MLARPSTRCSPMSTGPPGRPTRCAGSTAWGIPRITRLKCIALLLVVDRIGPLRASRGARAWRRSHLPSARHVDLDAVADGLIQPRDQGIADPVHAYHALAYHRGLDFSRLHWALLV